MNIRYFTGYALLSALICASVFVSDGNTRDAQKVGTSASTHAPGQTCMKTCKADKHNEFIENGVTYNKCFPSCFDQKN